MVDESSVQGEEYYDPNYSGNPLLDTSCPYRFKKLSKNFTVDDFARSGGKRFYKARIDPKLVQCLQSIRDHLGKPVVIISGYRSYRYNVEIYTKRGLKPPNSQHSSGRAADIKISGMSGMDIAKAAIDACRCNISIGIGSEFAHIDVRGKPSIWDYGGAGVENLESIKRYYREKCRLVNKELENPVTAKPRVLTYSTKDVIDKRISIPAQHSLVRLSKNPATNADAVGMLEEVKVGRLAGIYCVNWEKAAQRALKLGKNWWTVIPQSEDSVLMLDPDNLTRGQPMIAFRRELDPDCGLLKGEKRFAPSPARLDAALLKSWASYQRMRAGEFARCEPPKSAGGVMAGGLNQEFLPALPVSNLMPPILCQITPCPPSPCQSGLPPQCKAEAPACSTDPNWGRRRSFQEIWNLTIKHYYCDLPNICNCNPCCESPLKLRDIFSPELLIAIFFEETRFANIPQKPEKNRSCGPAYGFGQVQKAVPEKGRNVSAIWLACQFCGIYPAWTPQDILCDDAKSVQIAGMLLWRLYCLGGKDKNRTLLAYAGRQRQNLVNGWLDCEKRLKEIRQGSNQMTQQEFGSALRKALNQALHGRSDRYDPSKDDPCVFPCGQLPNLSYSCPSIKATATI